MSAHYPNPPWTMFGRAFFIPYLVRAQDLVLPESLEPIEKLGKTMGLLAYIEYLPPSPLTYHELIWMPCWVRCKDHRAGERGRKMAMFVARMYVDDEHTLEAGRVFWRLPKTMAQFEDDSRSVRIRAEDGSRIGLSFEAFGPSAPLHSRMSTLQAPTGELVRFRSTFRAKSRAAKYKMTEFWSDHPAFRSLETGHPLPRLAAAFESFEAHMNEPEVLFQDGSLVEEP